MAYTDFAFYTDSYFGDTLAQDEAPKWLERASEELDALTFRRLVSAFPTEESDVIQVKKAVCAIADALYLVYLQRIAASAQQAADGSYRGAITSISSGKESVSYAVNGATSASVYAAAAASAEAQTVLLRDTAAKYLAGIPDANGVNLLYAGVITHGKVSIG